MNDRTMTFSIGDQTEQIIRNTLMQVYDALKEKGYNPINQIVGYILSEDPTYITTHNNARNLMSKLEPDEILVVRLVFKRFNAIHNVENTAEFIKLYHRLRHNNFPPFT